MTSGFEPALERLRDRRSYKWRAFPPDVLPSFVAEMDFDLAPVISESITAAAAAGDTGYGWADPALSQALATFVATRFAWRLHPADVVPIPDVMSGVLEVLRLVCSPDDGVVINTPVYPPFFTHIREAGCRVVEAPLARSAHGYELDPDALADAFAGGARVYLLCNPHNPTGRVFTRAELQHVAELAERHQVLVLADEIHAPLVLEEAAHVPFLTVGEAAARAGIAFVSATKAWNIPGLKCAQMVACAAPTRAIVARLSDDMAFRIGHLGVLASIAAYTEGGSWLEELLAVLDARRGQLGALLDELLPGARYDAPEATYLAWVDCSQLGIDGDPAARFLERGRVALRPGPEFGANGTGFVRLTMATSHALLQETVQRMRASL